MDPATEIRALEEQVKAAALARYRAFVTEEERAAFYWATPILQGIISIGTHAKPLPRQTTDHGPQTTPEKVADQTPAATENAS